MVEMDDALRELLESGGAVVLGTRDAENTPEISRGWGLRVLPDRRTVEVCVGLPSGRRTLSNVEGAGRIAATFVRPSDYRQVQLKGRVTEVLDATPEDGAWADRHRQAFLRQVEHLGIPPDIGPRFWDYDDGLAKLRIAVEEAYDQTPGPQAGRRL